MKMRTVVMLLCALMAVSCASTGPGGGRTGYVEVLSSGAIRVNGRPVAVNQVGPTLRAKGFSTRSPINVRVPEDVSQRVLKMVTVSLTNSGFTRVVFIKPKQTSSDVKPVGPAK